MDLEVNFASEEFVEVLRDAQRGHDESFAILWRRYQPRLLRYLRVAVSTPDAEDVASLVWLDVARSLAGFSGREDAFRSWLFTIARHRVLNHRRDSGRRPATEPLGSDQESVRAADDPVAGAEWRWSTEAALTILGSLKPVQAEVLALRVIAGLEVDEVAKLVDKSPGAVRVIAHRGLRELAGRLEAPAQEPSRRL
jgi:RNA polymerase sigma-70 factor (ECF subfamily)